MNERQTTRRTTGDEGFTLIEVMVALLVFALISTGVVAGVTRLVQITADNRARVVAVNLAAQELDTVRSISDVYSIRSVPSRDIQVGDPAYPTEYTTYRLTRTVSWTSSAGSGLSCNNSADVSFLQVNVRVDWSGRLPGTPVVQDDTVLSPTGGTSSSSTGSISISVFGSDGGPVQGVAATVTPTKDGAALGAQPASTTAQGCTYANAVTPGTYSVTLSRSGYRDDAQSSSPSESVTVTAGTTQAVTFTYDKSMTIATSYAGFPVAYGGSFSLPTNLPVSFLNTSGTYTVSSPPASVSLFPFSSGYSAIAGPLTSGTTNCASVDPQAWVAASIGGVSVGDGTRIAKGAKAGGSTSLTIPVGVVLVRAAQGAALTATQATAEGQGNPGCAVTGTVLTYAATGSGSNWLAVALPFGSWTVKANGIAVSASNLQVMTNGVEQGVFADGTVTLDPRLAG